jgi:hypothetical protein
LTEVSSNYLVYLSSLNSAAPTAPADEEQIQETPSASQSIKPRRNWLLERALQTERWDKEEDAIEPASPHALYRLADKLDIADLKSLLKTTIIEGFTVENVSFGSFDRHLASSAYVSYHVQVLYELISTFSYHYTEMQDAALAFALLHWVRSFPPLLSFQSFLGITDASYNRRRKSSSLQHSNKSSLDHVWAKSKERARFG